MSRRLHAVRLYLETGGTGTEQEIAQALGIPHCSVHVALRHIRDNGQAVKVGERTAKVNVGKGAQRQVVSTVWGKAPACIITSALATRPPLQQVWA